MGMSEIPKSNLHVLRKQSNSDIPAGRQFVIQTNEVPLVECSVRRNRIQQAADRIPLKLVIASRGREHKLFERRNSLTSSTL